MTQYAGGKARIGKKIHDAIVQYETDILGNNQTPYFEPFVGMGGVLQHFSSSRSREVAACDKEESIISFWRGIQGGWVPRLIDKSVYRDTKNGDSFETTDPMFAFTSFGCSFRGMKWGGFSEVFMDKAYKKILKGGFDEKMSGVEFKDARSYGSHVGSGHIIYCDPPYAESSFDKRKNNLIGFNHDQFWETMRVWSKDNIVFVSERSAPDDFQCILEIHRNNGLNGEDLVEKLFVKSFFIDD